MKKSVLIVGLASGQALPTQPFVTWFGYRKHLQRGLSLGLLGWGIVVGVLSFPATTLAHGAHIQSRSREAIEIQATYDNGDPLANAQVQIYAPSDLQTPWHTSQTDAEGRYLFVPDAPGDWEVSVRQAGHGDILVIPVSPGGTVATAYRNEGNISPLQRGIMAGAVTWGCIGTALYFRRGKR
ncbi:carboxypeptidase-like regulatory domain-containing protein [Leptolyngbya sp. PCC 6406]|uniref:carboxypeptidase-like regulatory domain-containing protein n=1 Tax=Leptolyngbya sp. PCC 6406 TaxID=1173264 RepID=UPI0002AC51EE|nr:carboxypeptidase-like regulatory domain-containing protein [Leptolyngbya sp. PCC 6406]